MIFESLEDRLKKATALGDRIRRARLLRGMSQQMLANEICVSKQMISKYERGLCSPCSESYGALLQALDVPDEFFHRSIQMDINSWIII